MLDLDAGVHLDEVEVAVWVQDELYRAGVVVVHRLGHGDGGFAHARPQFFIEDQRGRDLDQLLVPALDRAVPLAQVDDVPVLVGEDLELDVVRPLDVLLQEDLAVPER